MEKKLPKWLFVTIISIAAAVILTVSAMIVFRLTAGGADTAEEALWKYERACMVYDVDTMVSMSSEYNRLSLTPSGKTMSAKELSAYLKGIYSSTEPIYSESELSYKIAERYYYSESDSHYAELLSEYESVCGSASPEQFAELTIVIYKKASKVMKFTGRLVKFSGRWYYFNN